MHPILAQRGGLWIYLAAWVPGAGLLATQLIVAGDMTWLESLLLSLPLSLVYAFICLGAWYPSQAVSPKAGLLKATATHLLPALFSGLLWILLGGIWALLLDRLPALQGVFERFQDQAPLLFLIGLLLYALVAAGHYLLLAFEASREAESRNLELQIQTREAELKALQAQRDQELTEEQLELARSIQRRLLPPPEIEGPGYRLAARNLPARVVAGDFYDIFHLGSGEVGIVVADVAGKGVGASLIMASVKAMLPLIATHHGVVETLAELNRKLAAELGAREFVALAFARLDPGRKRLELANSGLPDPYLLRNGGQPLAIEVPGPRLPLGVRTELEYESVEVQLSASDRVLFYTDGLPEACTSPGEPLGYEAMVRLMEPNQTSPGSWLDGLLERIHAATTDRYEDDLTALLLEVR